MPATHSDISIDHVIFYTGQALDALASFFERAGFTLTPLGRHSSGSVNRLAILQRQYLELVGFEPGTPANVRPELQALPLGLTGLAVADRPEDRRRFAPDAWLPSRRLERPVDMPGVQGLAAFTNTELRDPAPDVRVFRCRHHTPELVWHPAWQQHANGAIDVSDIAFHTRDPRRLDAALRSALDVDPATGAPPYDAQGTTVRVVADTARAALAVRTRALDAAVAGLAAARIAHTVAGGRVTIPLPAPYAVDLVLASA